MDIFRLLHRGSMYAPKRYLPTAALMACLALAGCASPNIKVPTFNAAGPIEQGYGDAALPDGSIYKGEFAHGLFEGKGTLTTPGVSKYEGEFRNGLRNGKGVQEYSNGIRYEGEFKDGMFDGKGVFTDERGEVFSGDFLKDNFTGHGKLTYGKDNSYEGEFNMWQFNGYGILLSEGTRYQGHFHDGLPSGAMKVDYPDGTRYEGGMEGWDYQGEGAFTTVAGVVYSGRFEHGVSVGIMDVVNKKREERYRGPLKDWKYEGNGVFTGKDGYKYEGEFSYGRFHGNGTLQISDSKKYVGEFSYGSFDGKGVLEFRNADGVKHRLAGKWENGKYAGDNAAAYVKDGLANIDIEKVMYAQHDRVEKALEKLSPEVPGVPDLYFVGFGSYGEEDVFMNEVRHSADVMDRLYAAGNRSLILINNPKTAEEIPLATVTNLETVLKGVARKMNVDEDILFLYVTSHGSKDHEVTVYMNGISLDGLTPARFRKMLDDSDIKWKVLVISTCYSGGLIEPLKDDHTLVITASSKDKQSFGCGNKSEMTYFGKAFFEKSLNSQISFMDAFAHARDLVAEWEKKEKRTHSEPQIASSPLIEKKLAQWQKRFIKSARLDTPVATSN